MLRAVGYFRLSKRPSGENVSIDVQREKYLAYVREQGYVDVGQFQDIKTGRRTDRPGYQAMLTFCRERKADVCVVLFLDRFGRDKKEINRRRYDLDDYGVEVKSIEEDLDAGDGLMGDVSAWSAERESKRIGQRTRAAQERKMREDPNWLWARVPFGWRVRRWVEGERVRREILLDEDAAQLVRRMAALYLDGLSFRSIAMKLNAEGSRNTSGSEWRDTEIRWMVLRRVNSGTVQWGKMRSGHKPGIGPPLILPGKLPVLLDEETCARIAERLAARGAIPGRALGSPSLLSGLLRCGGCGGRMLITGSTADRGDHQYRYLYYMCSRYKHGERDCYNNLRAEALEEAVLETLVESADAEAAVRAMPVAEELRDFDAETRRTQAELEAARRELLDQYELYRTGILDREGLRQVNERVVAKRDAAEQRLAAIQAEAEAERRRRERIVSLPARAHSLAEMVDAAPRETLKAALQELVEKITAWPDGQVEVRFRI